MNKVGEVAEFCGYDASEIVEVQVEGGEVCEVA